MFGSAGASLIGAVILGWIIDCANFKNKAEQSKRIFQSAHNQLYSTINSLMMVMYHPLNQFYEIKDNKTEFKYNSLSIGQLIQKYAEIIEEIKLYTSPVLPYNGVSTSKDRDARIKQQQVKKMILECKDSILDFRCKFQDLAKSIKGQKSLLLVNDSSYENDIQKIIALTNILGTVREDIAKENEFIELGYSFEELVRCNLVDVLDKIGFEYVRFDNLKGYFNIKLVKENKNEV